MIFVHYPCLPVHTQIYADANIAIVILTDQCSASDTVIRNLPEMRKVVLDTLNMVFMPKEFASQVALAFALQAAMVSSSLLHAIYNFVQPLYLHIQLRHVRAGVC